MGDPITQDELRLLDRVHTVQEWDAAVKVIRAARGGDYPCNWFSEVKETGLMEMIFSRWGGTPQLTLFDA